MENKIIDIFKSVVESNIVPCINYAVVYENKIFKNSIGNKSIYSILDGKFINQIESVTVDTMFDLASLTKVICTNTIIFRLVEENKLSLNDKVQKYLPSFKYSDTTIYELLTHTSGLEPDFKDHKLRSRDEAIKKVYSGDMVSNKGTFLYSDLGYILLGFIIEKICGKSLDKVFYEEVAVPLGMKNTMFNPKNVENIAPTEVTLERGVLKGKVHDEKAFSLGGVAGHAGLFSNVDDLVNYSLMVLNNGIVEGKQYLKKEIIDKWFTPLVQRDEYFKSFTWYVGKNPYVILKDDVISFSGFTGPSISIDRENKIVIIMLTNRIHPTRDNEKFISQRSVISNQLYDLLLKK